MKVVFSNYDDIGNPYYGGGGARAIHEVAKRLAGRHEVTVFTGKYPGSRNEVVGGVQYRRIGSAALGPRAGQLYYQFLLPTLMPRMAFDVWIESLTPPFSTACLQLFTRKPVVALTQLLGGKAMTKKYRLPFHFFEHQGLKTYRYAIALTDSIRNEIAKANPRAKITVIPNGVADELINKEPHRQENHILFLGRIDIEQKGIDLLLEAYRRVADQISWPLTIAGSGSSKDSAFLARRLAELGLKERVRIAGKVEGDRKEELLSKAGIFVMPSRFEAFPLALLEAFCYRVPVVMFAIPEFEHIPENCCRKITPFDIAQFGRAVAELTDNPELRRSLGENAKDFARGFGWNRLSERYDLFLREIAESDWQRTVN